MFLKMRKPEGGKRKGTLTEDTANALYHTLNGLVELTRLQLETTHNYVTLNDYCTDPIEGTYGILREGMGGTYFITVMNCIEKLCIYKTKLLLKSQVDVFNYAVDIGHECSMCGYWLDEKASE